MRERTQHGLLAHRGAVTFQLQSFCEQDLPAMRQRQPHRAHRLAGTAPPGPAMPVTATAHSARACASAPSTIARTTGSLTAPYAVINDAGTPRHSLLASFE